MGIMVIMGMICGGGIIISMDQTAVKSVFREKLQAVFTPELLEDADIVGITLLVGYRMFVGKCQRDEASRILNEAVNDEAIVETLIQYFIGYAEETRAKAEAEKVEAERKANQIKLEQLKKEQIKKEAKPPSKQKGRAPQKQQQGATQNTPNGAKHQTTEDNLKNDEGQQKQEQQKKEGETVPSLATQLLSEGKVKCKYFPFCKNDPCQYFHPTEKCPFFPRCRFNQTCMYLHEVCKFAENCTRSNCFYAHPFKKRQENPMIQFMKMAMGQMKGPKRPIRKRKPTEDAFEKGPEKAGEKQQQQK